MIFVTWHQVEYIKQTKYLGFMFTTNSQDDEDKVCSDKCVHCIFDQLNYYALFIVVLLMLNWNCLEVLYFILLLLFMDCIQKVNIS